jgi:hypothetical protein
MLQQKFCLSLSGDAVDVSMQGSDVVQSREQEIQEMQFSSPAHSTDACTTASNAVSQTVNNLRDVSLCDSGDMFRFEDVGCCCICTVAAEDSDPLGLLVSVEPDPLSGSPRSFLPPSLHADPLLSGVKVAASALIRSCGHSVHISCMQSWLAMHQGACYEFSRGAPSLITIPRP